MSIENPPFDAVEAMQEFVEYHSAFKVDDDEIFSLRDDSLQPNAHKSSQPIEVSQKPKRPSFFD